MTLSKTIIMTTIAASLFSLFGCRKAQSCRFDELTKLSYNARCADNDRSFSFSLRKKGSEWLLSAEFSEDEPVTLENESIDADRILAVVKSEKLLEEVLAYRAPDDDIETLDADEYILTFTLDGKTHLAPIKSDKLEEKFREAANQKE